MAWYKLEGKRPTRSEMEARNLVMEVVGKVERILERKKDVSSGSRFE